MIKEARVSFKRPDLFFLRTRNYTVYDMHVHTSYSDGHRTVEQVLAAARKKGIGISITDHNDIRGAVKAYKNNYGVPVIPGMEMTTAEGVHLLVYFYSLKELEEYFNKYILKSRNENRPYTFLSKGAEGLIEDSKYYNCMISAAHPFAISWTGLMKHNLNNLSEKVLRKIEAIEVICGSSTMPMNKRAINFAMKTDKCFTGGSDAHIRHELGSVVSYSRDVFNEEGFLGNLLKKKNFVVGTQSPLMSRFASLPLRFKSTNSPTPYFYFKKQLKFIKGNKIDRHKDKYDKIKDKIKEKRDNIKENVIERKNNFTYNVKRRKDNIKKKLITKKNKIKYRVIQNKDKFTDRLKNLEL
ncbi:MAG: PHP domain-containing protein [Candidatus Woesearchaeota archaeon]